jgi:hypothetical protein
MLEARIAIEEGSTDVESLWDWLRQEPEVRGMLRVGSTATSEGAMGATTELVVQAAVAVAGASAMTALARSLSVWLVQRRSDLTLKVTGPGGRQVSVCARRVSDPEQILRAVLESTTPETAADVDRLSLAEEPHTI